MNKFRFLATFLAVVVAGSVFYGCKKDSENHIMGKHKVLEMHDSNNPNHSEYLHYGETYRDVIWNYVWGLSFQPCMSVDGPLMCRYPGYQPFLGSLQT